MKIIFMPGISILISACGSSSSTLPSGTAATGSALYTTHCMSCHGSTATGGSGPNITSESSKNIQSAVRSGPGDMPAWTVGEITDQNLADIIAYIDSL